LGGSLIIFDMDGVLIDVSGSYRQTVRETVSLYLERVLGVGNLRGGFLTLADVDRIKKRGGLNNDWDLSYAIIDRVLLHCFDRPNARLAGLFAEAATIGNEAAMLSAIEPLRDRLDTRAVAECTGSGNVVSLFDGTHQGRHTGVHSPFLLTRGDVKTGNLVKRIFQERYLGFRLFREIYGQDPLFHDGEGLLEREKLIPSHDQLKSLSRSHNLSIATGRPAVEAEHAVVHFGIDGFFTAMVTEDDVAAAEKLENRPLRKPDPYPLKLCIEKNGSAAAAGACYVGDMPDDMIASRAAGVQPVGFSHGGSGTEKEAHERILRENGAVVVFFDFEELVRYFSEA
jgi:HAD superfamily hydrolase (TIGR01548 family)